MFKETHSDNAFLTLWSFLPNESKKATPYLTYSLRPTYQPNTLPVDIYTKHHCSLTDKTYTPTPDLLGILRNPKLVLMLFGRFVHN